MGATKAITGKGTTLSYATVSGSTFGTPVLVAELKDVKTPKITADKYEATNYTSPSNYKEWLAGYLDAGEVPFECNYIFATAAAVIALVGVTCQWVITMPDTHTYTFTGFLDDYEGALPNKGPCDLKLKVKVTGPPVLV